MKEPSESAEPEIFRQLGDPGISHEKRQNQFIDEDIYIRTAKVCSAITLILGTLAMLGWLMGIRSLASFVPGYIPIAPGASLAFILLGGAWYLYARTPSRWFTRIYVLVSVFSISLIALLNLIQFLTGANVGIEEYFTREVLAIDLGTYGAGPMSPIAAASFLLICAAMGLLLFAPGHHLAGLSSGLASVVVLVGLVVLLGYLYGTPQLYGEEYRYVALPAGIMLVFLGTGLIAAAGPEHFPLRLLVGPSTRALLMRSFLLVIFVVILIEGTFRGLFSLLGLTMALRAAMSALMALAIASIVISQISRVVGGAMDRAEAERKRAEQALLKSEQHYRSLFENMLDGFAYCKMLFDDRGHPVDFVYLEVNSAFERLTGLKNVIGKKVTEVIPGIKESYPEVFEIYGRVALTGVPEKFEIDFKPLEAWFSISVYSSEKEYFAAVFDNITERKRAEDELKNRTEELARSNIELEQFIYIASHYLQEPLRTVSNFSQLLAKRYKGKLDAKADQFIGFIVDGTTRMQQMIDDLLEYSRVSTKTKAFEPTDCEAVLDQALANVKEAVEESGALVTHDPLPTVMADASQMVQLFQNLLSNVIKFRNEKPRIMVSAVQRGNEWLFSMQDNGIGIAPEFMEHIFKMFEREHASAEYPGTGVGLAICKKIVERHGGRIWVESEIGKGSTFYFTIPAKRVGRP
ncbi:two-component system, chemotaxis family, sensor kinase Cph1 [Methanosarcinales archaeon]|nr:two-component system, chemotaxis family, sensor kinase Cph1 [Methanosarcinales archaeon]